MRLYLGLLILLCSCSFAAAQVVVNDYVDKEKKLSFNALFVANYRASLTENIDVLGKYHSHADSATTNDFSIKYIRLFTKYKINDKFDINLLLNLADVKGDVKRKIVENAYATYKFKPWANIRFGQFRSGFGIEDTYAVEVHRSYTWSHQYNTFGASNWMSFQQGIAILGDLYSLKIPLKYYLSLYNGNGKNASIDNDSHKRISSRLVYAPMKAVQVAASYAFGKYRHQPIRAYNVDLTTVHQMGKKARLCTESSFAYGHNVGKMEQNALTFTQVNDYVMKGYYILPQFTYCFNHNYVKGLELSCRYETFWHDATNNASAVTTIAPMASLLLSDKATSKLSMVGIINKYRQNTLTDNNHFMLQLQLKF